MQEEEHYDAVIVRNNHFNKKLQTALAGRPLHLVMECIGGKILMQGWKAMAPMGRMVVYGNASFTTHKNKPDWLKLYWKYLNGPKDTLRLPTQNKSLMGFNLIYLYKQTAMMHKMLQQLGSLHLKPEHIGHIFSFNDLHKALHLFQKGETIGKAVVKTP